MNFKLGDLFVFLFLLFCLIVLSYLPGKHAESQTVVAVKHGDAPAMVARYHVVRAASEQDLSKKVNELIKSGWQPHGSIGMPWDSWAPYIQPMVSYK